MADATAISFRKGTEAQHETFRGVEGEITVAVDTPTVWVHPGNDQKGTPLACADLRNVNLDTITDKGIAKTDLTNVYLSDPDTVRTLFAGLNYAQLDMSNVNTANLATGSGQTGKHTGKDLAYTDLSNIDVATVTNKLGNTYAKQNLDNINTANLASGRSGASGDKDLAYKDLSNVNTNELAYGANKTAQGTGLAYYDLSNASVSDAQKVSLGIQSTSNLVTSISSSSTHTQYPSAKLLYNIQTTLTNLIPVVIKSVKMTETDSPVNLTITMIISKPLSGNNKPTLTLLEGADLLDNWSLDSNDPTHCTWKYSTSDTTLIHTITTDNWVILLP